MTHPNQHTPIYLEPNQLPEMVRNAISEAGCPVRTSIPCYVSETESMHATSGDGCKGFATLINLDTGETRTVWGSWGGGNPFARGEHDSVDADTSERPLPPHGCIVKGYIGGSSGGRASITIHPDRAAKLLPEAFSVSERDQLLLGVYGAFNSRGRTKYFERHPENRPTQAELESLAARGFIKLAKNGAITITPAGRNNRGKYVSIY